MENSPNVRPQQTSGSEGSRANPEHRHISVFGIISRLLVAVIFLGGAAYYAKSMIAARPDPVQRQQRERSFTVELMPAAADTYSPPINAFGEIAAGKSIEIRSQVAGQALQVSPNLAVGGHVKQGELLVGIDSFAYDGGVREAEANLADARSQLTTTEEQLSLEKVNHDAAQSQLDLAERDLERAQALSDSGSVTSKTLDDRKLLVSQRQQTVAQRESAIKVQQAAVDRQQSAIAKSEWALEQAQRALENTEIRAPFDGIVISGSAQQGRVISNNEVVAQLYATDALEVRFTLSDSEYGQLVAAGLMGRPVTATWNVDPEPIEVEGEIVRVGAEVDAAMGGVTIFARLSGDKLVDLRPGTFVQVTVNGIDYKNAYKVPETAIYDNDTLYVRDGEKRMQAIPVTIATRDGEDVIIRGDVPNGADIITTHLAQAGDGVLVQTESEAPAARSFGRFGGGSQAQTPAPATDADTPAKTDDEATPAAGAEGAGARQRGEGGPDGRQRAGGGNAAPAASNAQ